MIIISMIIIVLDNFAVGPGRLQILPINTDLQLLHHDGEALLVLQGRLHRSHKSWTLQTRYDIFIFSQTKSVSASMHRAV